MKLIYCLMIILRPFVNTGQAVKTGSRNSMFAFLSTNFFISKLCYMKAYLGLLAVLSLLCNKGTCQNIQIVPFQIGERVPDLPIKNIINYKDSVATLSSFGNKIIIVDFWNVHCTSCIAMFPREDSLQALFSGDVQFILVTGDSKEKVEQFLARYNKSQKKPLSLPIITGDDLLSKMFRFTYVPHYVWLAPNGLIMAESSDYFITKENIANTLIPLRAEEARLKGNRYADFNLRMQKPDKKLLQVLTLVNN